MVYQCAQVTKTASNFLTWISNSVASKTRVVIVSLHWAWARPHLKSCIQFWASLYKKDIEELECVQGSVTE